MKSLCSGIAVLATLLVATAASAEKKGQSTVTVERTVIQLPPMRPLAAVEVARPAPGLPIPALRHAFLDKVETAVEREPF